MSHHKERMRHSTENPRFFFLTPRLLRHRQQVEMNQSENLRAGQSATGKTIRLEFLFSHDLAGSDIGSNIAH
jgi:hypothetical protein